MHEILCVAFKSGVYFPKFCEAPAIKPHWPSKSKALETVLLDVKYEADMELRTFTPVEELLSYYSSVCEI